MSNPSQPPFYNSKLIPAGIHPILMGAKIITLWQPWASAIAHTLKLFETRTWGTDYRGPLLIHAAKRVPTVGETNHLKPHIGSLSSLNVLADHLGCVVALVDLVDCKQIDFNFSSDQSEAERAWGNWRQGYYAWQLENVRPIHPPIPWRGQQGLKPAPVELLSKVSSCLS